MSLYISQEVGEKRVKSYPQRMYIIMLEREKDAQGSLERSEQLAPWMGYKKNGT